MNMKINFCSKREHARRRRRNTGWRGRREVKVASITSSEGTPPSPAHTPRSRILGGQRREKGGRESQQETWYWTCLNPVFNFYCSTCNLLKQLVLLWQPHRGRSAPWLSCTAGRRWCLLSGGLASRCPPAHTNADTAWQQFLAPVQRRTRLLQQELVVKQFPLHSFSTLSNFFSLY